MTTLKWDIFVHLFSCSLWWDAVFLLECNLPNSDFKQWVATERCRIQAKIALIVPEYHQWNDTADAQNSADLGKRHLDFFAMVTSVALDEQLPEI